ncbi:ABC transporter permease [Effusibacillus pohliae]|uniref:ABC transporter permease n=1 Tax=Effusibacillus pohliae TaxID=232270 RepID=UPI00037B9E27|nr:ABC transporter permease [Effusibacillus pohliae]
MRRMSLRLMNPILVKEFRSRMRTLKTPILLVLYLLAIGAVTFGFIYIRFARISYFNPGQSKELFVMLSVFQLILISFVVPGLTGGAIAGERERQTLNILLTTHLSPFRIVLSKLVSSTSFVSLLVFSTLPLYAVVYLYGGISPQQLLGVFGFYLMVILLFGSIGLFCSCWFKRTGVSTVVAYGLTFFVLGATVLIAIFTLQYLQMQNLTGMQWNLHPEIFYVSALNPVLNLVSMVEPEVVMMGQGRGPNGILNPLPMQPWLYFLLVYMPLSALLLFFSVRLVSPVKRPILPFGKRKEAAK